MSMRGEREEEQRETEVWRCKEGDEGGGKWEKREGGRKEGEGKDVKHSG